MYLHIRWSFSLCTLCNIMGYLIHPSTPKSSLARSVGQGFNGAQGTRTNAKHPPKSTLTTSFRSRKAIPRPVPLGTHLQGPLSALLGSTMDSEKLENQSSSTHPPTSRSLGVWFMWYWSCLWWSPFPSLLVILETRDAIRMKVADLESM
jgi:hypothetical protein